MTASPVFGSGLVSTPWCFSADPIRRRWSPEGVGSEAAVQGSAVAGHLGRAVEQVAAEAAGQGAERQGAWAAEPAVLPTGRFRPDIEGRDSDHLAESRRVPIRYADVHHVRVATMVHLVRDGVAFSIPQGSRVTADCHRR